MMKWAAMALALSLTSASQAAVFLSKAAFDAAHPGLAKVDFSDMTKALTYLGPSFSKDGLTFSAPNLYAVDTRFWGSDDSLLDNSWNGAITMTLPSVNAIGFFVAGSYSGDAPVRLKFFRGDKLLHSDKPIVGGVSTAFSFYGIDGLGAIDKVVIDSSEAPTGFASIGSVMRAVPQAAVPEPASWAMMIAGFGIVGAVMRRRKASIRFA